MQIAIPSLRRGRHVFKSDLPASAYGELVARFGLDLCGPVSVEAVVHKIQEQVLVKAVVRSSVRAECGRCLEPFETALSGPVEALYLPYREEEATSSLAHRIESESQRVLYYTGGIVDLGELIIERLALAVPMKPLCRPDCKGLCPSCGKNLNEGSCGCKRGGAFGTSLKDLLGDSC